MSRYPLQAVKLCGDPELFVAVHSGEGGLRAHVVATALGQLIQETVEETSADMFADNITAIAVVFDMSSPSGSPGTRR